MYSHREKTSELSNKNEKTVNRNIVAYIMLSLDITIMLVPVIMILWLEIGLSFHEILLLQGIFMLVILVSEVPSGALADSRDRMEIVIIGQLLKTVAIACYFLANNFWWCAAAEVSFGIGQAVISGSLEAMLYDSLVEHGKQDRLQSIVRKERIITFSTAVFLAPAGGVIGSFDIRLPMLILFIIEAIVTVIATIYLTEPGRNRAKSTGDATVKAIRKLGNPDLAGIAVFSISASVGTIVFWGYQKIFVDDLKFTPLMMGWVLASLNVVAALSSKMSEKFEKKTDLNTLAGFVVIDVVATLMILLFKTSVALLFLPILMLQVSRGSKAPLVADMMQRNLQSTERATFISLNSMQSSLVYMLLVGIINAAGLLMGDIILFMAVCNTLIAILVAGIALSLKMAGSKAGSRHSSFY